MDETVLQPLQMSRSTFKALDTEEKNYAPAYMTGKNRAEVEYHFYPEIAAAALWTTPSDLLKAVRAVQKSLVEGDFLDRKWAEIMLTPPESDGEMALGWMKGSVYFAHSGGNYGYICYVVGFADLPPGDKEKDTKEVTDGAGKKDGHGEEERKKECKGEEGDKEGQEKEVGKKEERRAVPKDCGICVMTSSNLGFNSMERIVQAIPYWRGWPSPTDNHWMTFLDRGRAIDVRARDWCGDWGPGDWSLVDEEGGMYVRFGKLPLVRLLPGVIASQKFDEGDSVDLVPDGLDLMLRLGWKEGSRIIEVWQNGVVKLLKRKPST